MEEAASAQASEDRPFAAKKTRLDSDRAFILETPKMTQSIPIPASDPNPTNSQAGLDGSGQKPEQPAADGGRVELYEVHNLINALHSRQKITSKEANLLIDAAEQLAAESAALADARREVERLKGVLPKVCDLIEQYSRMDFFVWLCSTAGQKPDPTFRAKEAIEAINSVLFKKVPT